MLHISLAAEPVLQLGPVPITNSLIMTWLVMGVLTLVSLAATRNLRKNPSSFQLIIELTVGGLYDFFSGLVGKHIKELFPLIATLFLFIITSNWMGLLPGVGTIGIYEPVDEEQTQEVYPTEAGTVVLPKEIEETEHDAPASAVVNPSVAVVSTGASEQADHENGIAASEAAAMAQSEGGHGNEPKFIPILRAPTADLNMTLGLGLIAFFMMQYYGFKISGPAYGKKFINLTNPIFAFVGFLEIISDISKIISFAFRLFGNIFAGEVLLAVIAYLAPFFLPLPFLGLEIFVGFIQALVFAMLTSVFIQMAAAHAEGHHTEKH